MLLPLGLVRIVNENWFSIDLTGKIKVSSSTSSISISNNKLKVNFNISTVKFCHIDCHFFYPKYIKAKYDDLFNMFLVKKNTQVGRS